MILGGALRFRLLGLAPAAQRVKLLGLTSDPNPKIVKLGGREKGASRFTPPLKRLHTVTSSCADTEVFVQ